MIKFIMLFFVSVFWSLISLAHNPDEAFFSIKKVASGYAVTAEFPWTLRNALLAFRPALEAATTKAEFEKAFTDYMRQHLQLKNKDGKLLSLSNIKEIESTGHSHQNTYELLYLGDDLSAVENTVLFDLYTHQKNYHEVNLFDKNFSEITSAERKIFMVANNAVSKASSKKMIWFLLPVILFITYFSLKKSPKLLK